MNVLTGRNCSGKAELSGGGEREGYQGRGASRAVTGGMMVAASAGEACALGACPIPCSLSPSRGDRMREGKKRERVTHQRGLSRGGKYWCRAGWPSS